jgi:V8-like Glu-specific endopeptidase
MRAAMIKTIFCLPALVLLFSVSSQMSLGQQPQATPSKAERTLPRLSRGIRLSISNDNVTPGFFPDDPSRPRWIFRYKHELEVGFLRLHVLLRQRPTNAVSWYLVVKDASQTEVERLTPESFDGQPPDAQAWTDMIEGREVLVELWSDVNPVGLKLEIDRLNYEFESPGSRAITTGVNSMQPLLEFTPNRDHPYYSFSLPIAIIRFVKASDGTDSNCTGFLLTPELLITNQHCISENWQLASAKVEFNYEPSPPRKETFKIQKIEMQDGPLDFSILKLKRPATNWPTVKIGGNPHDVEQRLVLIGHPDKSYKTISVVDCKVEKLRPPDRPDRINDFYHLCDTEGGESGSPVFDAATGRVVGLHYYGITGTSNNGRNLAININAILEQIRLQDNAVYLQIMQYTQ